MQWLVHIANKMDQVLQGSQLVAVRCFGAYTLQLLIDGNDRTAPIGAVSLLVVHAVTARKVDVVPWCFCWVLMLISPGGNRCQGATRLQSKHAVKSRLWLLR